MKPTLPLADMTLAEKLETLDELWADISHGKDLESPQWHMELLRERKRELDSGEVQPIPWEQAEKELRDELL